MLLEFEDTLTNRTKLIIEIAGAVIILIIWHMLSFYEVIPSSILPPPLNILTALKDMHYDDALVRNLLYSLSLNILGYAEAVVIALPLGFIIGLSPFSKAIMGRYITAARFLPLVVMTGLFMAWFGIYLNMKVQFLACGIIVYLLPVVIQRVEQTKTVYIQTVKTLGATKLQIIRAVHFPDVLSRVFTDIGVLVAISWTYITIAEVINKSGGIGAMIHTAYRQSRVDKVYGILILIMLIGLLQDKLFKVADKFLFPFKYTGDK